MELFKLSSRSPVPVPYVLDPTVGDVAISTARWLKAEYIVFIAPMLRADSDHMSDGVGSRLANDIDGDLPICRQDFF